MKSPKQLGYTSLQSCSKEECGFGARLAASATVVTVDQSQPACLGAGCHQISQLPLALGPGGETVRNELETYACNSAVCSGARKLWGPD